MKTLVVTSRELRTRVEGGDEDGIDALLKDILKFVNEIKENPEALDPETAASIISQEQTLSTLATVLQHYIQSHSAAAAAAAAGLSNGVDKRHAPNNLMRGVRVAQIVAEVAKVEEMRAICVAVGVIPPLVAALDVASKGELIRTHACRAIGNICFDCDDARMAVEDQGGLDKILRLLTHFDGTEARDVTGRDRDVTGKDQNVSSEEWMGTRDVTGREKDVTGRHRDVKWGADGGQRHDS
jgi:hypothetical protein